MKFSWHKTGYLEIILLTVLLIWIVFRYQHTLNQFHPEWIILGLAIGLVWCVRDKLHLPFNLLLLIAGMLSKLACCGGNIRKNLTGNILAESCNGTTDWCFSLTMPSVSSTGKLNFDWKSSVWII